MNSHSLFSPVCLRFAIALVATIAGCSKTPEKLYPVTGTVTVVGKPLSGGSIQFEMIEKGEASGKVYTSSGEIDENGKYELSTFGEPGAPAGEHRVWVSPNFAMMPDKLGIGVGRMSPVPKKYMVPTTTELMYTVTESDNTIDVEVPKD